MGKTARVVELPKCNFHDNCKAKYDFRTKFRSWAFGCEAAYQENRASTELGTGNGQKLVVIGD